MNGPSAWLSCPATEDVPSVFAKSRLAEAVQQQFHMLGPLELLVLAAEYAGDEIEFNAFNLMVATAQTIVGSANGYYSGCYGKWTVLRRF